MMDFIDIANFFVSLLMMTVEQMYLAGKIDVPNEFFPFIYLYKAIYYGFVFMPQRWFFVTYIGVYYMFVLNMYFYRYERMIVDFAMYCMLVFGLADPIYVEIAKIIRPTSIIAIAFAFPLVSIFAREYDPIISDSVPGMLWGVVAWIHCEKFSRWEPLYILYISSALAIHGRVYRKRQKIMTILSLISLVTFSAWPDRFEE